MVQAALGELGIGADIRVPDDFTGVCADPRKHIAMCVGHNWKSDIPSAANFLDSFFRIDFNASTGTLLGASPAQLRSWGYRAQHVPSVDTDLDRCLQEAGASQQSCWARFDQYLISEVVPVIPLVSFQQVRLTAPSITSFSWDAALAEPSLDRLAVAHP